MKTVTLTLPDFWVCPLEYGSDSYGDMNQRDIESLESFVEHMVKTYGKCWPVNYSEESSFYYHHEASPFGVLGCTCVEITFDIS